jgi:hypothetical protein
MTCAKLNYYHLLGVGRKVAVVFADLDQKSFCQCLSLAGLKQATWTSSTETSEEDILTVEAMFKYQAEHNPQDERLPVLDFSKVKNEASATAHQMILFSTCSYTKCASLTINLYSFSTLVLLFQLTS